jgi:hypothetical protein
VDSVYFAATDDSGPAVLVTPACDIEQDKVRLWTLVRLYSDAEVARAISEPDVSTWLSGSKDGKLSRSQTESLGKRMKELIGQRYPRYHWVPIKIGDHTAHIADFSCVTCLPADEVKKATRVGRLNSSWREQLPARYVAYMGRVGTTDFKGDELTAHVERLATGVAKRRA